MTWDVCRDFRESARKLMAGDHHRASGSEAQVIAALARLGLASEPQAPTEVGYRCAGEADVFQLCCSHPLGRALCDTELPNAPTVLPTSVSTLRSATWLQSSSTVPCTMAHISAPTACIWLPDHSAEPCSRKGMWYMQGRLCLSVSGGTANHAAGTADGSLMFAGELNTFHLTLVGTCEGLGGVS